MQPYIILSFVHITSNNILTRSRTGQNAGSYEGNGEIKKIEDFICNGDYRIHSILRAEGPPQRNGDLPTGTIFTLGDRLGNFQFSRIISSIHIIGNDPIFTLRDENRTYAGTIRLVNAQPYTPPVTQLPTQPVQTPNHRVNTPANSFDLIERTIIASNPRAIMIGPNHEYTRGVNISRRRTDTLEEFLVKFFTNWNKERQTLYVDNSEVQTDTNKRRSLGDIFMICRYYYPNCTLSEVIKLLYVTLPNVITDGFRSSYCSTIRKRVWYYNNEQENSVYDKTTNDEFGNPHRFYISNLE